MARLLILLGILGVVLWFLYWFRATPAHRVSQVLRKAAFWGVIGVLVLAAATGRLSPIFAAIGAAIPLVLRAAAVSGPRWIRYAWADNPRGNLVGGTGLPASPFETAIPCGDWLAES